MDYLDMRVFSTVNTDQSFINWAKTSRTVSTRNQCRKQIQRTWPQCSDWVGFRENTTKTTVPFIITFKMKQHGWKNTRIDLMTFPSAALPSGKEHLIEFKRMKPPQYLNEWHQSECYTLRKISPPKARSRCQGTRLDTTWTSDRHTSPMPPPLSHPALHAGTPSLLSFRKDGRRAAATPPDPGRFSPELSPLRRARCARPGPLEQPHHQQPAVLPEQLFPVRTGPPAHSGVSFIILTWPPPPPNLPSHSEHTATWSKHWTCVWLQHFSSVSLQQTERVTQPGDHTQSQMRTHWFGWTDEGDVSDKNKLLLFIVCHHDGRMSVKGSAQKSFHSLYLRSEDVK